jgi:hypothetical protein
VLRRVSGNQVLEIDEAVPFVLIGVE